jgi:signal transduction histidine kinase
VTWNRCLEETTGFGRAEMLGTPGLALVNADQRPLSLPMKGGGARQVRWRKAEASGGTSVRAVYVGTDVTDEQEMLRRTLRAERLAAVGTMAAGLAHEVRNPLNSASLQLTLLQRRLERGDGADATTPVARVIKEEIDRLDRLVREFLAFAQPRPLQPQPVAVADLFDGVVTLLRPEAEAAQVTFAVETPPAPLTVSGDPARLRQVLLNLTRNALEAMLERPGHVTLRARRAAAGVEIDVADDGPGFPEELPVFDAFFTTKPQGTGLGLSLTHRIVTDHGGTIRVRSKPGDTCFTITLPAT